eukprot:4253718-Pleurochrysis_carterae.AAC.1
MPWHLAARTCEELGGSLATVISKDFLVDLHAEMIMASVESIWIGLNDVFVENDWRWVESNGANQLENWAPGQPDDGPEGVEHCVSMMISDAKWHDRDCRDHRPFACQNVRPPEILSPSPSPPPPPPPFNRYIIYTERAKTWHEALASCIQQGGTLATIPTALRNSELRAWAVVAGSSPIIWIGATDIEEEGVWRWVDTNALITWSNWRQSDKPVNQREHCAYMEVMNGEWEDYNCRKKLPYACEARPPPAPHSAALTQ